MLKDLYLKEFLDKTAGNDPVPGGGSVSALCGAIAASLAEMVTGLTIGRKKYVDVEEEMKEIAQRMADARIALLDFIDRDAEAYDVVFQAFKLPKDTDEQKAIRSQAIQEATLKAALVPLEVAKQSVALMEDIDVIARKGNSNAITDACVAMMNARTAALGAILNVRINLTSLKDETVKADIANVCAALEAEARKREEDLISSLDF